MTLNLKGWKEWFEAGIIFILLSFLFIDNAYLCLLLNVGAWSACIRAMIENYKESAKQ